MKIGICDYGIGGIGLYKILRNETSADIVYFSDSGYTPYGKVPQEQLQERLRDVIRFFNEQGVEYIAIACNAASTVLEQSKYVTGIIEHGIRMVQRIQPKSVAVVGGNRTIESNAYKAAFEQSGISVSQRVAQPLSIRIEAGDLNSPELDSDIAEIFTPIRDADYILLACTHYPVIANRIATYAPHATFLDPVREMSDWIYDNWPALDGSSTTRWITTGDPEQMKKAAALAFDVHITEIEKIQL